MPANDAPHRDARAVAGLNQPPSRKQTDALFAAFQVASGDNDPIHYNVEYCRRRAHPGMLAHGMQVTIQRAAEDHRCHCHASDCA